MDYYAPIRKDLNFRIVNPPDILISRSMSYCNIYDSCRGKIESTVHASESIPKDPLNRPTTSLVTVRMIATKMDSNAALST